MLDALLARARADDNVVGAVLHGSRARGRYLRDDSDWDVILVVRELRDEYDTTRGGAVEVAQVTSLERLPEWMLPAVTWATPLLDKTGELVEQLRTITTVEPATAGEALDGYINSYYRSVKNSGLASLLDAQESIPYWLQFVFNVHGRIRPYNKWLEWELERHPLPVDVDLALVRDIATHGELSAQQALFRTTERLAREAGLGAVVDGWEPDLDWLRG